MSQLRTPVRRTRTSGAYIYATVEEVNMGHATVRLANGGQRLTNLPCHGVLPESGDRVIVDYSSEGRPYVRRVTNTTTTATNTLDSSEWEADLQPADEVPMDEYGGGIPTLPLSVCRITLSQPYTQVLTWNAPNPGFYNLMFDKVEYDTANMFTAEPIWNGAWPVPRPGISGGPGKYLVRYTMALGDAIEGSRYLMCYPVVRGPMIGGYYCGGQRYSRWKTAGMNVLTGTAIIPLYRSENRICLAWGDAFANSSLEATSWATIPVEEGKWPVLEAWKIADLNPLTSGERNWNAPWIYD